jgi:hypothetical protein
MVPENIVERVNVSRNALGAWVDSKGRTYDRDVSGQYRDANGNVVSGNNAGGNTAGGANNGGLEAIGNTTFQEGAFVNRTETFNVTRMVSETIVERVPVQTRRMEQVTRQVPVTVTRMVQEEVITRVPYTVCKTVPVTVTKTVAVCVPKQVCCTHTVKVPYCVTECVPTKVCKRVPVTVCEDVCKKVARRVEVCQPACVDPCKAQASCGCSDACKPSLCERLSSLFARRGNCGCAAECNSCSSCGGAAAAAPAKDAAQMPAPTK